MEWYDPNDLDLKVYCPCNTYISLSNKCDKCGGHLDLDMNHTGLRNETNPFEHVLFGDLKPGKYKAYVFFYKRKLYQNGNLGP